MDDIVLQAMAKWPGVPDCYGWMGLDSRGQWWMRDEQVQSRGAFQSGDPAAKGSLLSHEKLIDFIHRNYEADEKGRWYFQNGPQRVFVELAVTPHIWRIGIDGEVTSHTGAIAHVHKALVDEQGRVFLSTTLGFGMVHSLDVLQVALALEISRWPLHEATAAELPVQYAYVTSPQKLHQADERK